MITFPSLGADLLHVGALVEGASDGAVVPAPVAPGLELGWRHLPAERDEASRSMRVAVDRLDGRITPGRTALELPLFALDVADELGVPLRLDFGTVHLERAWVDEIGPRGRFRVATPALLLPIGLSNTDQDDDRRLRYELAVAGGARIDAWGRLGHLAATGHLDAFALGARRFQNGERDTVRLELDVDLDLGLGVAIRGRAWTLSAWGEHLRGYRPFDDHPGADRTGSLAGLRLGMRGIPE